MVMRSLITIVGSIILIMIAFLTLFTGSAGYVVEGYPCDTVTNARLEEFDNSYILDGETIKSTSYTITLPREGLYFIVEGTVVTPYYCKQSAAFELYRKPDAVYRVER